MFLIEFSKDQYIDAERIDYVTLTEGSVKFTVNGDRESLYRVGKAIEGKFLNQMQALNQSLTNPEARHRHLSNPAPNAKVNK